MRYKKRIVQISFALLFWNHFDEEKLLFHNVGKDTFAYYRNGKTFLGATPEILVKKDRDSVTSYAVAGSF